MLRSKQYVKLYKKYNSLKLDQPDHWWFVATRAYNQVGIIIAVSEWGKIKEWRQLHEKTQFIKY